MRFYKNDYKIAHDLQRVFKPFKLLRRWIPQPRDFLLAMVPKGGICCEVGVWTGDFSDRITQICRPKDLYLIDPYQSFGSEEKYSQQRQDERYQAVRGRFTNVIRKTSDDAANDFSDQFFDFVYIDGDHSYEQVKKDLTNYSRKVKPGGLLCGDDYHIQGVQRAVDEFGRAVQIKNRQFIIRL